MGGGGSQTIRNKMEFSSTTKILEENITENMDAVGRRNLQILYLLYLYLYGLSDY